MNIELNLSEQRIEDIVENHLISINKGDRSQLSMRGLNLLTEGGKITVLRQGWTQPNKLHRFDLLTHERYKDWHLLNLFELKRDEVNEKALTQVLGYADEILTELNFRVNHKRIAIKIHLIAPHISENLYVYQQLKTDHYSFNFQDINFDSIHGLFFDDYGYIYRNMDEFFKNK